MRVIYGLGWSLTIVRSLRFIQLILITLIKPKKTSQMTFFKVQSESLPKIMLQNHVTKIDNFYMIIISLDTYILIDIKFDTIISKIFVYSFVTKTSCEWYKDNIAKKIINRKIIDTNFLLNINLSQKCIHFWRYILLIFFKSNCIKYILYINFKKTLIKVDLIKVLLKNVWTGLVYKLISI